MRARADDCFTTGLFLETGLLAWASEDLRAAADVAKCPAQARPVQERLAGQVPHPARGAALAREWNLSEEVAGAISSHHDERPPGDLFAKVAWAAERVAAVFEGGDPETARTLATKAADALGLPASTAVEVIDHIPNMVSGAATGFKREVGEQLAYDELMRRANQQLLELNRNYHTMVHKLERLLSEKDELNGRLEAANKRLAHIASTDGLTGLFNHRTFQEELKRDLARAERSGSPLSLILFDVDHFKKLNDTWGHQAGDAVLKAIGKLLLASVRTGDVAARYGGEEFVVILPDTPLDGAQVLAERLRVNISKLRIKMGDATLEVTSSFGVAEVAGKLRHDGPELIERADAALYAAKGAGRNNVQLAPPPSKRA
jgi:diguanylate cyclase (GGDEF)-like protein